MDEAFDPVRADFEARGYALELAAELAAEDESVQSILDAARDFHAFLTGGLKPGATLTSIAGGKTA